MGPGGSVDFQPDPRTGAVKLTNIGTTQQIKRAVAKLVPTIVYGANATAVIVPVERLRRWTQAKTGGAAHSPTTPVNRRKPTARPIVVRTVVAEDSVRVTVPPKLSWFEVKDSDVADAAPSAGATKVLLLSVCALVLKVNSSFTPAKSGTVR